eukprot:1146981-Pelagomonas_calceolata.AAC.3
MAIVFAQQEYNPTGLPICKGSALADSNCIYKACTCNHGLTELCNQLCIAPQHLPSATLAFGKVAVAPTNNKLTYMR